MKIFILLFTLFTVFCAITALSITITKGNKDFKQTTKDVKLWDINHAEIDEIDPLTAEEDGKTQENNSIGIDKIGSITVEQDVIDAVTSEDTEETDPNTRIFQVYI